MAQRFRWWSANPLCSACKGLNPIIQSQTDASWIYSALLKYFALNFSTWNWNWLNILIYILSLTLLLRKLFCKKKKKKRDLYRGHKYSPPWVNTWYSHILAARILGYVSIIFAHLNHDILPILLDKIDQSLVFLVFEPLQCRSVPEGMCWNYGIWASVTIWETWRRV